MNLASRCREAIAQAANMKRDLASQKRKTAEAVAQTRLLLDQLKRMKMQQLQQAQPLTIQDEASSSSAVVLSTSSTGELKDDAGNLRVDDNDFEAPTSTLNSPSLTVKDDVLEQESSIPTVASDREESISSATETNNNEMIATTIVTTSADNNNIDQILTSTSDGTELPNTIDIEVEEIRSIYNEEEILTPEGNIRLEPSVAIPSSKRRNIVDLDTSFVFESDSDENTTIASTTSLIESSNKSDSTANNANSIAFDNQDQITCITEPSSRSLPENTNRNLCEESNVRMAPSKDDEPKLVALSDKYLMNGQINVPDKYLLRSSTVQQREKESTIAVTEKENNTANVILNEKAPLLLTSNAVEDEFKFDDSEHKCEDDDIPYSVKTVSTSETTNAIASDDTSCLVSSDDYEAPSFVDHSESDIGVNQHDDGNLDISTAVEVNDDSQNVDKELGDIAEGDLHPTSDPTISLLESPSILKSDICDISASTVDGATDAVDITTVKNQKPKVALIVEEKKNLWMEDYDEAAQRTSCDDNDDETSDTLSSLISSESPTKREYFPHSASPKVSTISTTTSTAIMQRSLLRRVEALTVSGSKKRLSLPPSTISLNGSFDEEFPSDIIEQRFFSKSVGRNGKSPFTSRLPTSISTEEVIDIVTSPSMTTAASKINLFQPLQERGNSTNLLSSIDAFEASFQTSFPESFIPTDGPSTSPSSVVKPFTDNNVPSSGDPFLLSKFCETQTIHAVENKNVEESPKQVNVNETSWGNRSKAGERPSTYFQENSSSTLLDDVTERSTLFSSRLQQAKANNLISPVLDQSTRWLMEIKASTEKNKCQTDISADEVSARLPAASTSTPHDVRNKALTVNMSKLDTKSSTKSMPITPTSPPQEFSGNVTNTEPVFRQFPRTTSPVKQIWHSAYNANRVDLMYDAISVPISNKAQLLLNGRTVGERDSHHSTMTQENVTDDIKHSARSRYVNAVSQASPLVAAERGRSSISRRMQQIDASETSCTENAATSSVLGRKVGVNEDVQSFEVNPIPLNVRERAAMFSKGSNSPGIVSPRKCEVEGNTFGTSRSTVKLLEDEGDIPMQSSISPRKFRNGEYTYPSPPKEVKRIHVAATNIYPTNVVDIASRKYYPRSPDIVKTTVTQYEDRGISRFDVGKQRRHINLSGSGRSTRPVDHASGKSPISDST
jgi:hypothetical protein